MKNQIISNYCNIERKVVCIFNNKTYNVTIWEQADSCKWIDWEVYDCNGDLIDDDDIAELVIDFLKKEL